MKTLLFCLGVVLTTSFTSYWSSRQLSCQPYNFSPRPGKPDRPYSNWQWRLDEWLWSWPHGWGFLQLAGKL